jgi:hypothetical protein
MLQKNELLSLMKTVAKANPSAPTAYSYNGESFSYGALNETLRREMNEIAGTYALYRENMNLVFSLIEETLNEVVPARTLERYGQFAETKTFAQGDKPVFTRRMGHMRAKQFITRVGLAGVYEVFKLGGESFEVQTSAIGGAAQIGFEEFLDGRADFAEVVNIVMEGMDELIYREIAAALQSSVGQLPTANVVSTNGFDETLMDRLIQVASVYGKPAIYCTYEFAVKMLPAEGWVSDTMRDMVWSQGYLGSYKGCPVIVLPQSFEDETNSKKLIDPGYAWVIPAGADSRPVKVAFEGATHVRERENEDWSRDIQVYRKVGVGVMLANNICSYIDTELAGKLDVIPTN